MEESQGKVKKGIMERSKEHSEQQDGKAKPGRQVLTHVEGNGLWAGRPGGGKGAGESGVGWVWGYMHGRGNRGPPERRPQADPGADKFCAGRRIAARGA